MSAMVMLVSWLMPQRGVFGLCFVGVRSSMLVSAYGRTSCVLQVLTFFALGCAVAGGLWWGLGDPRFALLGLIPVAFGLFVLSFYRDPERTGPSNPELCLSPADGVVTDICEVDEPSYLGGKATRVGIFLSPLNVHVNRVSLAGTVEKVVHKEGLCLAATTPKCIDANESMLLGLRVNDSVRIALRQVTGALARSIVVGVEAGVSLERGQRYGMIKLGSRTELLVPVDLEFAPAVEIGDAVRGGETVLGRIPRLAPGERAHEPARQEEAA